MIQTRPLRFLVKTLFIAVAMLAWSAERQAAFAQPKPEAPGTAAPNKVSNMQQLAGQPPSGQQPAAQQPAAPKPGTVQAQPAGQQTIPIKPVQAQPQMGPPNPADEARGAAAGQPAIPSPTVQLKPGEVPGIKFDVAEYDFGKVAAGQQVLHDFWFTNTGNGPLEILSVKPS